MKNNIIITLLLSIAIFFAFQSKPKQQFFVEGSVFDQTYSVQLTGEPNQIFHSRYDLLKYMNNMGYECVTHSFIIYKTRIRESKEFFIFE